jgi:hypothetical protein
MSGSMEDKYSTMFSSLKHPARRKILKMLSEKSMTFSEMLEKLEIPGSHLTYHLETLDEFLVKMDDGKYNLSSFGKASVSMMKGAEEVPSKTKKVSPLSLKRKAVFAVLLISLVLLASLSFVQYLSFSQLSKDYELLQADFEKVKSQNQQLSLLNSTTDKSISFLRDIIQIDLSEYQVTLLSHTVEDSSDFGNTVEEIFKYFLADGDSQLDIVLRFRNNHFSLYQISILEGFPPYGPSFVQSKVPDIVNFAQDFIERYKSVANDSYLDKFGKLLSVATETNTEVTMGNTKLRITINGDNAKVTLLYTANGFDYPTKSLTLVFQNHALQEIDDDWFLYEVGSTQVAISRNEAVEIARTAADDFEWNASGVQVSNFNVLSEPVSALFFPHPRTDPLILEPYWYITLYLDREYPGGVSSITVGVWADTGEVANIEALSSHVLT